MLSSGELSMGAIAERFNVTGPAISQLVKILKNARLVNVRVDAQRRIYSLNPDGLIEIEEWSRRIRGLSSLRKDPS
jgi:DNA-binding transcriptional ArsR family regulator